jgi:uncharacterized membrane protein YciS (DUF1049 family)
MRWVRRILLIGLLVALPVAVHLFISRHSEPIAIDYVVGRVEGVALWLALLVAFAAGVAVASLLAMLRGTRLRLEARRYRRAVRELEAEVHQLRNLPLSEEDPVPPPADALAAAGEGGG